MAHSIRGIMGSSPRARRHAAVLARVAATSAVLLGMGCHARIETFARAQAYEQPYRPIEIERDDTDPVCLSTFAAELEPYGVWVDDPELGLVWVPDATLLGVGYQPYVSAGHWSYTEQGYYWESDHSWGWVTFHYGRWSRSVAHGWVWVPGARFAPAWVEWRHGGGWIGWAPARPSFHWHDGVAYEADDPPSPWAFVHASAFFSPYLTIVVAPGSSHDVLMGSTSRWLPPPPARGYVGARPFIGPDPVMVGLPSGEVARASRPVPMHVLPHAVPWGKGPKPAPKVAPTPEPKAAPPLPPAPKGKDIVPLPPPKTAPPPAPTKPKPKPAPGKPKPDKPFT